MIPSRKGDGTGLSVPGVSEVRKGDGTVLWSAGSAIPDSVVSQYQFEDDSTTTTAIDSVGTNDATISGGSYDADARCGSFALSTDGTDDRAVSNATVDLSAQGSTTGAAVGGFFKPASNPNAVTYVCGWDNTDAVAQSALYVTITSSNEWRAALAENENFDTAVGPTIDTANYQHVVAAADGSDVYLIVDGTEVARTTGVASDVTGIGSGSLVVGRLDRSASNYYAGLSDNASFDNSAVTESDAQTLIGQC